MLKRLLPLLVVLLLCVLGKANDRLSRMVDETSGGQEVCSHDGFLLSAESSIALLRALPSVGNLYRSESKKNGKRGHLYDYGHESDLTAKESRHGH